MQSSSRKTYISHKIQDYQSVSTQTETVPILENILDENMEKNYTLFIRYINDINARINEKIKDELNGFTIPAIPNYYAILNSISRIKNEGATEKPIRMLSKIKTVASEEDYVMVSEHQELRDSDTTIISEEPTTHRIPKGRLAKSCFAVVSIRPIIIPNNGPHGRAPIKARPNTPKKIQGMFQKISRPPRSPVRDFSSDESVILDDEEFERANQSRKKSRQPFNKLSETRDVNKRSDRQNAIGSFDEVKPNKVVQVSSEKVRRSRSNDIRNRSVRVRRQAEGVKVHRRPSTSLGVDTKTNSSMESYMNMRG